MGISEFVEYGRDPPSPIDRRLDTRGFPHRLVQLYAVFVKFILETLLLLGPLSLVIGVGLLDFYSI